ncbi:GDSL-type esterase/lipase family protein [Roseobacter sp. CCS2]|uniref:GDSL-type esterase/lipase family protein n=1 Tax=Roseobacter sp. CCS2 TaxID=391593 RepID=UPI0018DC18E3|nr:GDSL-type esterase/lipase family protein [Roseobacter sp. CCS2]
MTIKLSKYTSLAVFLAISVALGVGLTSARTSQSTDTQARFSPHHVEERRTRLQLFEQFATQSEFVMIGDSITHRGLWTEFLPNYSVANRGIGGDTTDDVLRRMDSVLNLQPKFAFTMIGINDLSYGVETQEVFENYTAVLDILMANDITPIIQSTLACRAATCGDRIKDVAELNLLLAQYAAQNGIIFVDLNAVLADAEGSLRAEVTQDGLHLNGLGYKRWVDVIEPIFRELTV